MKFSTTGILVIASISIILLVFIVRNREESDIHQHGVLISVKVIDILFPSKGAGSFDFRCSFIFKGEQRTLVSPVSIKEQGSKYVGKFCPALYSSSTNSLRILLTTEDFEKYSIPLTDRLIVEINRLSK